METLGKKMRLFLYEEGLKDKEIEGLYDDLAKLATVGIIGTSLTTILLFLTKGLERRNRWAVRLLLSAGIILGLKKLDASYGYEDELYRR